MKHILWKPDNELRRRANMSRFIAFVSAKKADIDYQWLHQWSIENRQVFWQSIWAFFKLSYSEKWQQVLDEPDGMFMAKWFIGSRLNYAENLLRFRDDSIAIEFCNERNETQQLSYAQLYQKVAVLAAAFRHAGLKPGDRLAAVMPNIPETIIAMLACSSIGAVWSCCSPDFGVNSLADRFSQIQAKFLIYSPRYCFKGKVYDCSDAIEQLQKTLDIRVFISVPYIDDVPSSDAKINQVRMVDFIQQHRSVDSIDFEQLAFDHPLYILYSSGTTGVPKCIVHGVGGTLLQHLKELALHCDLSAGDRLMYYTSTGWMMWNWMVSSLALGACLVLYDGSPMYPRAQGLLDLAEQKHLNILGCSAKYISSLQKQAVHIDADQQLKSLKMILSTGSPLLAESFDYVYQHIKSSVQLCSISGGTDLISCFALGNPMSPVYRGELQGPGLGMAVDIFNEDGQSVTQQKGELVCRKAFPSMPVCFWNDKDNKKYHKAYFEKYPGVWAHGDYAQISHHGGLIIYGRSDATLNPGGVRIGTAEIYRQVELIESIEDALVTGQQWQGDQRIILFVKLMPDYQLDDAMVAEIKQFIRRNTSPHHVPAKVIQVQDIPKTFNGKTAELAVNRVIHQQPVDNLSALLNPQSLDEYQQLEVLSHE